LINKGVNGDPSGGGTQVTPARYGESSPALPSRDNHTLVRSHTPYGHSQTPIWTLSGQELEVTPAALAHALEGPLSDSGLPYRRSTLSAYPRRGKRPHIFWEFLCYKVTTLSGGRCVETIPGVHPGDS